MTRLVEVTSLSKSFAAHAHADPAGTATVTSWRSMLGQQRRLRASRPTPGAAVPKPQRAVDDVSFSVEEGETLALVGESGSGKSTTLLLVAGLLKPDNGQVRFDAQDVTSAGSQELRSLRRQMQVVFQDPFASLDPRMRVATAVAEPLAVHRVGTAASRRARADELLERVGLDSRFGSRHPNELSGGQAQRVCIARALALEPRLLLLDEPTSALDVSVQAQIVTLLCDLQRDLQLTYLFVSHNLGVVAAMANHVAVMQAGRIVEQGDVAGVYRAPEHPYTQSLLGAVLDPWDSSRLELPDRPAGKVPGGDPPVPGAVSGHATPSPTPGHPGHER